MENQKIKKINILYLLSYIFIPIVLCAICFTLSILYFPKGTMAVILVMVPFFGSIMWWILGGKIIYKINKKKLEKSLDESGFKRNNTFYGDGCTVVVDQENGKIAMLFFWNPFDKFIISAKRITKAWVDDGKNGIGILEGSSCVSFLFTIDDVKVRVYTFKSNQRWKMNSNYILTGISKADKMVNVLETARNTAK